MSAPSSAPPPSRSPFRSDLLASHVALVTGGGSGIGLEIAHQLGLHGAAVVLMGRREAVLDSAVEWLTGAGVKSGRVSGDVRKSDDCKRVVEEAVKQFGRLDVLVNCAAGKSAHTAAHCAATPQPPLPAAGLTRLTRCTAAVLGTASCVRLRI